MYLGAGTDAREVYVGLTRHRHDARVVVERDRLDALCRQRQADPRVPATDPLVLERLFKGSAGLPREGQRSGLRRRPGGVRTRGVARTDRTGQPRRRRAPSDPRGPGPARSRAWLGVDRLIVPAWRLVDAYGQRLSRASAPVTRALVTQLARRLGRPSPEPSRDRGIGIER